MFFTYEDGVLTGIIGLHVDDFLHAGNESFNRKIIKNVMCEFMVGKNEKQNFAYTGFLFSQKQSGIHIDQNHYTENLEVTPIDAQRALNKNAELSKEEYTDLRKMAGSLNWIVRGS